MLSLEVLVSPVASEFDAFKDVGRMLDFNRGAPNLGELRRERRAGATHLFGHGFSKSLLEVVHGQALE